MSGEERRRWRRLRTELRVQLEISEPGGTRTVPALGSHLNPTGIFVRMADPPALGSRVRVTLGLEGTHGVLTADGVVVDRVELDSASDRPPGVGVRLEQTGPAWKKIYDWLIEEPKLDS